MIFFILLFIGSYLFYYFTGNITLMLGIFLVGLILILWGSELMLTSAYHEVERAKGNIEDGFQKRHDVLVKLIDTIRSDIDKRDTSDKRLIEFAEEKTVTKNGLFGQSKAQSDYERWYQETRQSVIEHISNSNDLNHKGHMMLSQSINDVEENLSAARRFYNNAVKGFNSQRSSFPGNIIARVRSTRSKFIMSLKMKQ